MNHHTPEDQDEPIYAWDGIEGAIWAVIFVSLFAIFYGAVRLAMWLGDLVAGF